MMIIDEINTNIQTVIIGINDDDRIELEYSVENFFRQKPMRNADNPDDFYGYVEFDIEIEQAHFIPAEGKPDNFIDIQDYLTAAECKELINTISEKVRMEVE